MAGPVPFLMYHELGATGRTTARSESGYLRYVVPADRFAGHLDRIAADGQRGVSVGDAMRTWNDGGGDRDVVLTFDDGCETDLVLAADLLAERDFRATFFVTVDHVGRPGFLSPEQVRTLADRGFEIGSHGMTHRYMSALPPEEVRGELADSRRVLQEMAGAPVVHFSCPGGRWSRLVASEAREAGYQSVCTSSARANRPGEDPFRLGRFALLDTTTDRTLAEWLAHPPVRPGLRASLLDLVRTVLGDRRYDAVRARILGDQGDE